ncbi:MAG TPA: choice-of-anchor tandem repeat GloVer-containing protein [Rhizomicrobium sp.]|nr:choice-of-anchor tandem repeat GloVer-containing protein [Rhizomicrobium sp.]
MNSTFLKTALLGLAAMVAVSSGSAEAKKFKVLHSFAGGPNDGANPYSGVVPDPVQVPPSGYYVATDTGGANNLGTLTFISTKGAATVVHSFGGAGDGDNADGTPVISLSDYVVGTTRYGGANGCGTVYRYTVRGGAYTDASFSCYGGPPPANLAFPFSGPTVDPSSDFVIGTAPLGGGTNNGGWYAYDTSNGFLGDQEDFSGSDGSAPYGGILRVAFAGDDVALYIPASAGGSSNLGTITVFDSSGARVLHNFTGGSDGANPRGTLLYNNEFFLYGTTYYGGGTNLGTVFRMDISGGNYTVLHVFQGICCGNSDGSFASSGLTLNPKDGKYYGTTINGGGPTDNGTVYKIDPSTGAESVVHAFTGPDGAHPTYGNLYIDSKGKIYGTTLRGGAHNLGVVFRLKS